MTRSEEITSLYRAGLGQRAIARKLGLSQPGVRKWLLRLGLLPAVSPSVLSPGGDNRPSSLRSGDPPPEPPLDFLAPAEEPSPSDSPSPETVPLVREEPDPSLVRLLRRFPHLAIPPPWRCEQCGSRFRRQLTEKHCCVGCWYRSQGKPHRIEGHTADCRRWRG